MEQAPIRKEQITQYLPENPIILEAGAHIGRDTLKMALLWPQATIHAFEPVPELYEQLRERTSSHDQVHTYPTALSTLTSEETFYVSSGASTAVSSLFEPHEYLVDRPNVFFKERKVPTITLDDWAVQYGINHVDFMWLDMQGAECKVLEASTILFPTVKVLVMEANLTERFKGVPLLYEVVLFMNKHGFEVVQKDTPKHNKCNILCVRNLTSAV